MSLLQSIVGDDESIALELFQLFYHTAERCIGMARQSTAPEAHKRWRDALHEFRGAAVNIGAIGLAGVLHHAESLAPEDLAGKAHMLSVMQEEYDETAAEMRRTTF